ncbi:23S ribosomal RNA methyltransferase Erm [Microbacterium sp. NPDC055683]
MRPRSRHGGRHELGQNFLIHTPTIERMVRLVDAVDGPVLEIGAGDGALTRRLARLGRSVTALEIDETRLDGLARIGGVRAMHGDVLRHPLDVPVVVGNVPFHLTTPILRRLLGQPGWRDAILLTQWEVARKRAGVGGATLMTAQAAPWFRFALHGRVPAAGFVPRPAVDGGLLSISRRPQPLVATAHRRAYERFAGLVFAGRGQGVADIAHRATGARRADLARALRGAGVDPRALPRDLGPEAWATLWEAARR